MKKSFIGGIVGILYIAILTACSTSQNVIHGDGNCVTEIISVKDYDRIKISGGGIIVNYDQLSDNNLLEVKVDQNIYEIYSFKVNKRELLIEPKSNSWNTNIHPTCFIINTSSSGLVGITVNGGGIDFNINSPLKTEYLKIKLPGSGNVNINEEILAKSLDVNLMGSGNIVIPKMYTNTFKGSISGSGDIRLGGESEKAIFKIMGSGGVYSYDLKTKVCESNIFGSGGIHITATESVSGNIFGSGDVLYKGEPADVKSKVMGSGNIRKVD